MPLWEIPDDENPLAAPAFAITQCDADGSVIKTRRGDDWKKSGQNQVAVVTDKPSCHHVDYLVDGARAQRKKQERENFTSGGRTMTGHIGNR